MSSGSSKPTQIRVRVTRLSTTFLLEDRTINSSFFLEDRRQISRNLSGICLDRFPKLFWNILRAFPTFYQRETARA
jgi:hypothetical protein